MAQPPEPSDATRTERDPLGTLEVPAAALYGIQTLRAVQNFPISGFLPLEPFVLAQVWIKKAAALTHKATGRLDAKLADAIVAAADEVIAGIHAARQHFAFDCLGAQFNIGGIPHPDVLRAMRLFAREVMPAFA